MLYSSWHAAPSSPDGPFRSRPPLQHNAHQGRAAWSEHSGILTGGGPAIRLQMGTLRSRRPARLDPVLSTTAVSRTCLPWIHAKEPADLVPSRSRTASLRSYSPTAAVLFSWPRTRLCVRAKRCWDVLRRCTRPDTINTDLVVAWHDLWTRSERMGRLHVRTVKSSAME